MYVPEDMPCGIGEECVDELDDEAELESGTGNAGNTCFPWCCNSGVLLGFEAPV